MLGVTFFGILLTPVFFFVIDRAAGTHLFSSGRLHQAGNIALDVIRLRFIRKILTAKPGELQPTTSTCARFEPRAAAKCRGDKRSQPANTTQFESNSRHEVADDKDEEHERVITHKIAEGCPRDSIACVTIVLAGQSVALNGKRNLLMCRELR